MTTRRDEVWKDEPLVRRFLTEVRGGIPLASEQLDAMRRVVEAARPRLGSFLDLGCGDGILSAVLLSRFPDARATLVDFSPPMLDAARARLQQHGERIVLLHGDLASAAWLEAVRGRAPFDAVVSGYAIHHQPDARKRELYAEIFALLAPGGCFINVEHVASRSAWIESLAEDVLIDCQHEFQIASGSGRSRAQVADELVRRPDKAANILAPVEVQCEWLRAAGFVDVDCFFKVFELAVFGGRKPAHGTVG